MALKDAGKGKTSMYVGLPRGKLGVKVRNDIDQDTGLPTIVISSINNNSKVKNLLFVGDSIISLNGCNVVPTQDHLSGFTSSDEDIEFQEEMVDNEYNEHEHNVMKDYTGWFQQMLKQMGKTRYLCIERQMDRIQSHPDAETVTLKAAAGCLGIVVRGRKYYSWLPASYRYSYTSPLWVSHVFDSSDFNGQIFVGSIITHLNGHLLTGIQPDHFVEMMHEIGEKGDRLLTFEQMPSEIDLY
jgi:PDZ domain-containing secreted protein